MEPGGQTVQAFFQPLAEKSEQVPDEMTGIGWLDGRLWLYLGMMSLETGIPCAGRNGAFRSEAAALTAWGNRRWFSGQFWRRRRRRHHERADADLTGGDRRPQ